eukprot:scaffold4656_cov117-Isochrysis_galbana.AAC.5
MLPPPALLQNCSHPGALPTADTDTRTPGWAVAVIQCLSVIQGCCQVMPAFGKDRALKRPPPPPHTAAQPEQRVSNLFDVTHVFYFYAASGGFCTPSPRERAALSRARPRDGLAGAMDGGGVAEVRGLLMGVDARHTSPGGPGAGA